MTLSPSIRAAPNAAKRATSLMHTVMYTHPPSCPCHTNPNHHHNDRSVPGFTRRPMKTAKSPITRSFATPAEPVKEYAFEFAASSIRFGPGVTKEIGMDLANMDAKRVAVVTDPTVNKLDAMDQVRQSLDASGINATFYTNARCEPKENSVMEAIEWARDQNPDIIVSVGGGSVMDTAKFMALYSAYPNADFFDFINAPIGKGLPVDKKLIPHIAVPTTAGTGSETTGTAILDIASKRAKTGVASRALKPTIGLVDPLNTRTMSPAVRASSGLDVLLHSLESWTAIPFNERSPRPANPILRPAYQGANPISDVFSFKALQSCIKYLPRSVRNDDDMEAHSEMLLAATLAGVGFGNAGVHLAHGLSYPVSGLNPKGFKQPGYDLPHALIPHGVSVAVNGPAVFKFTAASNPRRHLQAAEAFGADISRARDEDAGEILSDALVKFLADLGDQPAGLKDLGFQESDIDALVEGSLPQRRVLMLAPNLQDDLQRQREQLRGIIEDAMSHK